VCDLIEGTVAQWFDSLKTMGGVRKDTQMPLFPDHFALMPICIACVQKCSTGAEWWMSTTSASASSTAVSSRILTTSHTVVTACFTVCGLITNHVSMHYLLNWLTFDHVSKSRPWLTGNWRSRSWLRLMQSVWPWSRSVCFLVWHVSWQYYKYFYVSVRTVYLQCFDAVGWVSGRASGP